jgi:hypothetical protein
MRHVRTEIEINAAPALVWAILTDFPSFPAWNPFIRRAEGTPTVGSRLEIQLQLGGRLVTFRPRVTVAAEARELRWAAPLGSPRLFSADRRFVLSPADIGICRFEQSETGSGLLAPVLMPLLRSRILAGYHALNTALKERAEHFATSEGGKR